MQLAAVIASGGKGIRLGSNVRKQYLSLGSKPMLAHSVGLFAGHEAVSQIIVAIPEDDFESAKGILSTYFPVELFQLVAGGATRQQSINNALQTIKGKPDLVAVHDAARPLASASLLDRLIEAALEDGAAVPVIPLADTAKQVDESGMVLSTPSRKSLRLVQTPQVFRFHLIAEAYGSAERSGLEATDDSALVELLGKPVKTVEGELSNLKVTSALDLALATILLDGRKERD